MTGPSNKMDYPDATLANESRAGNREAFAQIVARYQSLICAIAYSATGRLGQSEDLAQETFLSAWRQLPELREPEKLRAWLCGIVRRLAGKARRQQSREPIDAADSLECIENSPSTEPWPAETAIAHEEESILWRSLQQIPETYREPLVLFYREHQSIETVAVQLELSEDAVKQRLSRGRKLLQGQVLAFVEGALERSRPGRAFTLGVVAALPMFTVSASAATVGATAAKGSALANASAIAGLSGAILGPILGILGGWLGVKANLDNATSEKECRLIRRAAWMVGGLVAGSLAFFALVVGGVVPAPIQTGWTAGLIIGFGVIYSAALLGLIFRFNYRQRQIRLEAAASNPGIAPGQSWPSQMAPPWEYRSAWTFLGLPLVHIQSGRRPEERLRPVIAWIAIGDLAIGVLFAAGGMAIGGVSLGGMSIGLLAFGGVAAGGLAGGGLAIGGGAVGGAALGYLALGGCAMGWHAASGGLAVAHHLALGGSASALHANDAIARAYMHDSAFFRYGLQGLGHANWLMLLCFLPLLFSTWRAWRVRSARRPR